MGLKLKDILVIFDMKRKICGNQKYSTCPDVILRALLLLRDGTGVNCSSNKDRHVITKNIQPVWTQYWGHWLLLRDGTGINCPSNNDRHVITKTFNRSGLNTEGIDYCWEMLQEVTVNPTKTGNEVEMSRNNNGQQSILELSPFYYL